MKTIDAARFKVSVVLAHASSGVPLVTGLLTWAVAAALGWTAGGVSFDPGYADPLNYLLTTGAFLGPITAGATALAVGNTVRSGVVELATGAPRGKYAAFRVSLSAVVLWQLISMATLLLMLFIHLHPGGARDAADFSLVGLWVTIVTSCGVVGAAVGSLTTSYFAPPTTAIAVFIWIYGFSFASGKAQRLSPVYPDVFYRVWYQPHLALIATQCMGLIAMCLVASALLVSRRLIVAALAVVCLLAAMMSWSRVSSHPVEYRTAPQKIPCRMLARVSLCMWPESLPQGPEALRALEKVTTSVQSLYPTPRMFTETGLPRRHAAGEYQMPAPADGDYMFRAVLSVLPPLACHSQRALDAQYSLSSLLSAKVSGRANDPQTAAVLRDSNSQQKQWVQKRVDLMSRACP